MAIIEEETLKLFFSKIELYGTNLFNVSMNQMIPEIIGSIMSILITIGLIGSVFWLKRRFWFKLNDEPANELGKSLVWALVTVGLLIGIISSIAAVNEIINWLINPEWMALQNLIEVVPNG